jgi:two-component system C4-dicarboxylate transport response regulator DctD
MIVDDDEVFLLLMHHMIERLVSVEIASFNSPTEALNAFHSRPEMYEFVITDLQMPAMDGLELARRLHALAPTLEILLVTGSALLTNAEAIERGLCGLVHKPFSLDSLLNALPPAILKRPRNNSESAEVFTLIRTN